MKRQWCSGSVKPAWSKAYFQGYLVNVDIPSDVVHLHLRFDSRCTCFLVGDGMDSHFSCSSGLVLYAIMQQVGNSGGSTGRERGVWTRLGGAGLDWATPACACALPRWPINFNLFALQARASSRSCHLAPCALLLPPTRDSYFVLRTVHTRTDSVLSMLALRRRDKERQHGPPPDLTPLQISHSLLTLFLSFLFPFIVCSFLPPHFSLLLSLLISSTLVHLEMHGRW